MKKVDPTPQIAVLDGTDELTGEIGQREPLNFSDYKTAGLLDLESLYIDLLEYKAGRRYDNVSSLLKRFYPSFKKGTCMFLQWI
jgi:hypothetical protein